ncbi:MAG: hypothetical protein M1831_000651 [Alyxoria varia]|nr:MAG: hypothetical protein M1831_000651 [Alyxoria varia]
MDLQTGQKKQHISQVDFSTPPRVEVDQSNRDQVTYDWGRDLGGSGDDTSHKTTLLLPDLYNYDLIYRSKYLRPKKPSPVLWGKDQLETHCKILGTKQYEDFLNDESTLRDILYGLYSYGIVIIQSVPREEEAVEKIAERIGKLKDTFYGRTWDVQSKADAENVAYTSQRLDMHMDLLYMREPPGLQCLHCLEQSDQGGATLFADSFKAISEITSKDPTAADILTGYPVSYKFETQEGPIYFDSKPIVELDLTRLHDHQNQLRSSLTQNDDFPMSCVKAVNWSPPFQAPFIYYGDSPEIDAKLPQYKEVAALFNAQVNSPENVFSLTLKPGECVIFNNRRLVHGRTEFQTGANRWLKGAYLDMDDFDAKLRAKGIDRTFSQIRNNGSRSS